VKVDAESIVIDRLKSSSAPGIFSLAAVGSTGNAGSIEVLSTGDISLVNGSGISSSTSSTGTAGSVTIQTASLRVDGAGKYGDTSKISAAAANGSSGQTGNVSVTANHITLANGGQITITNQASVGNPSALQPTSITVTAPRIFVNDSPDAITSQSSGNVAASNIAIHASQTLRLDNGGITTTANQGNGGSIEINKTDDIVKTGLIWLENAQIASSVNGDVNGNGGNIRIDADALILKTGFIQANTKAKLASGGEVNINVTNLLTNGGPPFVGGSEIQTFRPGIFGINVIQAAAPDGVNGALNISAVPLFDISSSLFGLDTGQIDTPVAGRLCQNSSGSSLVAVGRGGLPPTAVDFISPGQLDRLGLDFSVTAPMPGRTAALALALAPYSTATLLPPCQRAP
jgi:hypothetical protein